MCVDLVKFTKEILNEKIHFLISELFQQKLKKLSPHKNGFQLVS